MSLEFYIFKLPQSGIFSLGKKKDGLIFGMDSIYNLAWFCVGLHFLIIRILKFQGRKGDSTKASYILDLQ